MSARLVRHIGAMLARAKQERLLIFYCDHGGGYLGHREIGVGRNSFVSATGTAIFGPPSCPGSAGIVLAHNHPSGACHPSVFDLKHTARLRREAPRYGLAVLDHLIVTRHQVYSMRRGHLL